LIRSGLRLRYLFELRTAHSGNDRGSRIISSYRDSMRALLGRAGATEIEHHCGTCGDCGTADSLFLFTCSHSSADSVLTIAVQ
jgi:hypothetical protein